MTKPRQSRRKAEEPAHEQSLTDFIRANYQLISVLGVFIALIGFISNLQLGVFGSLLMFLFLVGAVLIWLELSSLFPTSHATWRLTAFDMVLWMITGSIAIYWFSLLQSIWEGFYTILFLVFLLWLFWASFRRVGELRILYHAEPRRRRYIYISYAVIAFMILFFLYEFYEYVTTGSAFTFLDFFRSPP